MLRIYSSGVNEFLYPTLSGVVATLVATALVYGCSTVVKRVKEDPDRYTREIARLTAALNAAVVVPALVGGGWLLHRMLRWGLDWAARVAATPGTDFDDVPDAVWQRLFEHSWPWQYTCAAFVVVAPLIVTGMIADRVKETESLSIIRHTFLQVMLGALALLAVAVLAGIVVGAHVAVDTASAWAFATEPAYFPGLTEAWSLPWDLEWTVLAAVAAGSGCVQYYTFLAFTDMVRRAA
ncbi:hypothetical protein GCM10009834_47520 [Streptomonospora arabica]